MDFVDSGHDLIVAADSNASDLIREIATECGVDFDEVLAILLAELILCRWFSSCMVVVFQYYGPVICLVVVIFVFSTQTIRKGIQNEIKKFLSLRPGETSRNA